MANDEQTILTGGNVVPMRPAKAAASADPSGTIVDLQSLEIVTTTEVPDQAKEIISSGAPFRLTVLTRLTPDLQKVKAEVDEFLILTAPKICITCDGRRTVAGKACDGCRGVGEIPFRFGSPEEYTTGLKTKQYFRKLSKATVDGRFKLTRPIDAFKDFVMSIVRPIPDDIATLEKRYEVAALEYREDMRRQDAERDRLAQEAQRKWHQETADSKAKQLEAAGQLKAAEIVRTQAATAPLPAPRTESSIPIVKGVSFKHEWRFVVEDSIELPEEYWIPRRIDEDKIKARVEMMGEKHGIAGVLVWTEEVNSRTGTRGA
jgi:hypothetical protein